MSKLTSSSSIFLSKGDRFPKSEKLSNIKIINALFQNNLSEFSYPFKVIYLRDHELETKPPQVLISVSKKKFKRAVDRNRIKRQIREIYRQNKRNIFTTQTHTPHYMAIIFVANKHENFFFMEKRLVQVLTKISQKPLY